MVVHARPEAAHGDETLQSVLFGQRCAAVVSEALLRTATSREDTLKALDKAIAMVEEQLRQLSSRGAGQGVAAARSALELSREGLLRRRKELSGFGSKVGSAEMVV